MIYLKVLDAAIGAWSTLALFRAMGLPSSVSSSASVAAVLFFSFVTWAAVEVWGNVLLWTLAQICNRWQNECWQNSAGSLVVEDGLRLRRDGRVIREDDSDDSDDESGLRDDLYEDGDMDLGNIATARGFGSNAYFSQARMSAAAEASAGAGVGFAVAGANLPAGHSANAMSVPRLNLRGVGSGGGAGGSFVPKLNFSAPLREAEAASANVPDHETKGWVPAAETSMDVSLPPIMQALTSAARASSKGDKSLGVHPAEDLHPTDFEQMWIDLETTSLEAKSLTFREI